MTIIEIDIENLYEIKANAREIKYIGKLIFARFSQKFFIYQIIEIENFYQITHNE